MSANRREGEICVYLRFNNVCRNRKGFQLNETVFEKLNAYTDFQASRKSQPVEQLCGLRPKS